MASSHNSSAGHDAIQLQVQELTLQLEAARAQLADASPMQICSGCGGERRPTELAGGMCGPCRRIRQMDHHLAKLRTVTEMSVLMAGRLAAVTGESRHVILDHFERQAAIRISAADSAVTVSRASA